VKDYVWGLEEVVGLLNWVYAEIAHKTVVCIALVGIGFTHWILDRLRNISCCRIGVF
jgi:hypothetical protein